MSPSRGNFINSYTLKNSVLPGTGIHLCITHGQPVTSAEKVSSLVNSTGNFKNPTAMYNEGISKDEVVKEFEAQILKVKDQGIKITHIDTHHHIHSHPLVLEALIEMAVKYRLPARNINQEMKNLFRSMNIPTPNYFCGDWFGEVVSFEHFQQLVSNAKNNAVSVMELMTHPGMVDTTLAENSSYRDGREKELKILCDDGTKEFLHDINVQLYGYDSL